MGVEGPTSSRASDSEGVAPASDEDGFKDYLNILSGTGQNVVGIAVAALATFVANLLMSNKLGAEGFGVVTLMTQGAFVLSFATRSGMDMAVLRDVAVEAGLGSYERIRAPVGRAVVIATAVSAVAALAAVALADSVRSVLSIPEGLGEYVVEAAALGLPFLALANVWLSATRGLKIMRYTLYVFWAGQPVGWVLLMLAGWQFSLTEWMSVLAYSLSWVLASIAAYYFWRRESAPWEVAPMEPGRMSRLLRYAGPRAPAALFSQLLFWTDLFVLTRFADDTEVGVYSAVLRAGQVVVLFLTSVSLMFSPFVADLHNRGQRERLDKLFKALTRWTLALTMPAFLILVVAPDLVLRIFGPDFTGSRAEAALLIVLAGQFVNVATGSVGFVLIMVGRTGWDLLVYAASLALNLGLAFALCPRYGLVGAGVANAVTFALSKWARLALVKRFVDIQPYDRLYGRLLIPAVLSLATMFAVHWFLPESRWLVNLLGTGLAGLVVYAGAYLLFGLTDAERRGAVRAMAHIRARLRPRPG